MSAEQLIGLEAALAEVSDLYAMARGFAALQQRAEHELLPQIAALGARLRRLVRAAALTDDAVGQAARDILGLAAAWRAELEAVRAAPAYRRAVEALAASRQDALSEVIPQVFAGLTAVHPAPDLYFPVSAATGRRRPGFSPFLSPAACADKIERLLAEGVTADVETADWWERDLPSLACADTLSGLETPIALRLAAAGVRVAVFAERDGAALRVFTARLQAPFAVVLARDATDEWWEAYQDSYHAFRDALQQELAVRGHVVSIEMLAED